MKKIFGAAALAVTFAAHSQDGELARKLQEHENSGKSDSGQGKAVAKNRPDPGDPHFAQRSGYGGRLIEEKQVHTGHGQEPSAAENHPRNQDHAKQQDGAQDALGYWLALAALLANIPTWSIAVRYGRRQAKAAEAANEIARGALLPDVRWSSLTRVWSSIGEGDNAFNVKLQNLGVTPVSIRHTQFSAFVDGVEIPAELNEMCTAFSPLEQSRSQ